MNNIPDNLVPFPAFLTLLDSILRRLVEDDFENLEPWAIKAEVTDSLYNLYRDLLAAIPKYIQEIEPAADAKIEKLHQRLQGLYKKSNYNETPTIQKMLQEKHSLQDQYPSVSWIDTNKFRSETYCTLKDSVTEECDFELVMYLSWILMSLNIIDLNSFAEASNHWGVGILPLTNFAAWEPLFKVHKMSNRFLCEGTYFGKWVKPDSEEIIICADGERHDDANEFTCFLSRGSLTDWIRKFKEWNYTREETIEFFGPTGFFTHLYNHVHLDLSEDTFLPWIHKVVIPEFNHYFPKSVKTKRKR